MRKPRINIQMKAKCSTSSASIR